MANRLFAVVSFCFEGHFRNRMSRGISLPKAQFWFKCEFISSLLINCNFAAKNLWPPKSNCFYNRMCQLNGIVPNETICLFVCLRLFDEKWPSQLFPWTNFAASNLQPKCNECLPYNKWLSCRETKTTTTIVCYVSSSRLNILQFSWQPDPNELNFQWLSSLSLQFISQFGRQSKNTRLISYRNKCNFLFFFANQHFVLRNFNGFSLLEDIWRRRRRLLIHC